MPIFLVISPYAPPECFKNSGLIMAGNTNNYLPAAAI